MTSIGDPGHITGHNTLEDAIRAQATRFGVTVTLTGPYAVGAPNHIGVHNLERQAILDIASAGGVTVTVPDEAELNELGHTTDHDTLTAAVAVLAAAPAFNTATGGTETTYVEDGKTYRLHTFRTPGDFTVTTSIKPFDLVLVGGGGGGGRRNTAGQNGYGGGGGKAVQDTLSLPAGVHPTVIGAGGAESATSQGNPGQASTFYGFTAPGGIGAYEFQNGGGGANLYLPFDGTGTQGYGVDGQRYAYNTEPKYGGGGGGGAADNNFGERGDTGALLIRYQIA